MHSRNNYLNKPSVSRPNVITQEREREREREEFLENFITNERAEGVVVVG
jgi:hypothetical protein